MNVGRGQAQDPLNYLLRQISRSNRYSKVLKRHIILHIRRSKTRPYSSLDEAVSDATALMSYVEILHLRDTIDQLKPTDKGYSQAVHAWCKLMENYRRSLSRGNRLNRPKGRQQQPTRVPPMRQPKSEAPEEATEDSPVC